MDLLTILFGGGATGIVGTIISQVASFFTKKQQMEEMQLKFAHEIKLQEMQLASLQHETEREVLLQDIQASSAALQGAYNHDTNIGKPSRWVVDIIRLFRPSITLLLVTLTGAIYFTTSDIAIEATVVDSIIFCTIAAMTFWFGDRTISKNVYHHSDK